MKNIFILNRNLINNIYFKVMKFIFEQDNNILEKDNYNRIIFAYLSKE